MHREYYWYLSTVVKTVVVMFSLATLVPLRAAVIQTTRTNNTNFFVDGSSATSSVAFGAGSVGSQVLEARVFLRFMKADGQSYGVNNGGTPYYNEIDLRLTSPDGTTVSLISPGDFSQGFSTGGFGFGQIQFRTGSGYDIVNIDPLDIQAGNFRPTGDQRDFENETAAGTWTLFAADTAPFDGLSIDRLRVRLWSGDPEATVAGLTDFGNVLVGSTADLVVNVENTGDTRNIQNDGTLVSTLLTGTIADPVGSGTFSALGSASFSNLAVGAGTADRTYRFSPVARSAESATVQVNTDGGNETRALTGQGVAPQVLLDVSAADAGQVRVGDTGSAIVSLTNVGDGNLSGLGAISNLNGNLTAASGVFSGSGQAFSLADSAATSVSYVYAPTNRGTDSQNISLELTNGSSDGTNSAVTQAVPLTGQAVGPEFSSTGDAAGVVDFGNVEIGQTSSINLAIGNSTPDGDLGTLTDLSLLASSFSGIDSADFSLIGFAPTSLTAGGSLALIVEFTPSALGARSALLSFATDQDAPFGIAGTSFNFLVQGNGIVPVVTVPEPATFVLFAVGLLSSLFDGRRRRARRNRR